MPPFNLPKMDGELTPEIAPQATEEVYQGVRSLCSEHDAGPEFVIRNLRRLARFRGHKAFLPRGVITLQAKEGEKEEKTLSNVLVYSKLMDFPEVQLNATKELAALQDLYPAQKQQHTFPEGIPFQLSEIPKDELPALKAAAEAYVQARFGQKED